MFFEISMFKTIVEAVISILPTLEKMGPMLSELKLDKVLEAIAKIIQTVAEILGCGHANIEELGAKAEQSGLNPDDFETYDDYMKALYEFQLDPAKMDEIPLEVRLARGISVVLQRIEDLFPVGVEDLLPELVGKKRADFFTPVRIAALLDSFAQADLAMRDMIKYFDSGLGVSASLRVEDAMVNAEKQLKENAGKTDDELLDRIQQQRN
ncbi:MAG: hypothetical protein LHW56_08590 [Candidatus Cloacimonetes bacterium]|nr:hypothetical protein [Candidatus Cloacimonadota bacterium]MDY0172952.1 hypothetical protein [Candidatus Cloacimonadaceae bacterium]